MKLSFTLSPDEVYEAQKLNYFRSKGFYFLTAMGLVAFFVAISIFLASNVATFSTFVLIGLSFSALTYPWLYLRYFAHSINYEKTPSIKGEQHLEITDNGIKSNSEFAGGDTKWSTYIDTASNKKIMIVYLGPNVFHPIPRGKMTDSEWNQLTSFVKGKIKHN